MLQNGQTGFCGVRRGGVYGLETTTYGRISACHLDPVEKKPFFHFKPGTTVLSVGGVGCSLHCGFCQNHHLLQTDYPTTYVPPEVLVKEALHSENCSGIAFTYNEGSLFLEYILDVAALAHVEGLKILLVTNGYLTETAFEVLSGDVDAMNIDLKGFSEVFYELQCCGHLAPVLQLIQGATKVAHIELTFLAIEPLNTDLEEFQRCVDWIAGVNPDLPLHISRYFPCYTMSLPETPLSVLYDLKALAQKSLHHVYVGNVPGASAVVFCPYCQKPLADPVSRAPLTQSHMMCSACGSKLYGSI
jgi:pyruvate formate lyase activating enzyme